MIMRKIPSFAVIGLLGALWFSNANLNAAEVKTYQVTGPVLEVTPTTITVQKGKDKWEIARTKSTKITAEPKVGDKVTIYYQMVATEVEQGKKK
jgi:hypothetical protein